MAHDTHEKHAHAHGDGCGHPKVQHDDHFDYLHDGHLHHVHGDHVDEHQIADSATNPAKCAPHSCGKHDGAHTHGANCGHPAIPHAGHVDYVVDGHLHHVCEGHCDNHGAISFA